jgi:hypothetical protein
MRTAVTDVTKFAPLSRVIREPVEKIPISLTIVDDQQFDQ